MSGALTREKLVIPQEVGERLPNNLIMLGLRGSHAHGTATADTDDIDLIGVYFAPVSHYLGVINGHDGTVKITVSVDSIVWDVVCYELRKFVSLLLKQNPNVLQTLFLPDDMVLMRRAEWLRLKGARHLFLSKLAYYSFVGYAWDQLKRMERKDFRRTMSATRWEIIQRYGYDTKAAAHLIRLLIEGMHFLQTGTIRIPVPYTDQIISIKRGEWSREDVIREADVLLEKAKKALEESPLPEEPDRESANAVAMDLTMGYLCKQYRGCPLKGV